MEPMIPVSAQTLASDMDPNATLKRARVAALYLSTLDDANRGRARVNAEEELVDAFRALDEWLSTGGFLPTDWDGED